MLSIVPIMDPLFFVLHNLICYFLLTWQNQTKGLFGNWSFDMIDDFALPDGTVVNPSTNVNNFERVHKDFGIKCKSRHMLYKQLHIKPLIDFI